jgi:hypothetical protein
MARKITFFEKAILLVGVAIAFLGIFTLSSPLVWGPAAQVIMIVLLWLILLVLIISLAIGEDVKEELGDIIRDEAEQIKLLKSIAHEQLQEIRLLTEINLAEKKNLPLSTLRRVKAFHKRLSEAEEQQGEKPSVELWQ